MPEWTPHVVVALALVACSSPTPPPEPAEPAVAAAEAPVVEAAPPPPAGNDTLETSAGRVTFVPLQHATFVMRHGESAWVVDPWSEAPLEGVQADVVLLTDIHQDHLDPAALTQVQQDTTIVVGPAAVDEALEDIEVDVVLANGETAEVAGARVTAVPMYNLERGPEPGALYHPKGRGNGYIVEIGDARIYIAGDTECTEEMRALTDIDVAFVPMNLPYTMPPEEAAECIRAFAPDVVYPYHFRDADLSVLQQRLADTDVEVRIRDWYAD